MSKFIYKGIAGSNSEVNGEIVSKNRKDALAALRKKNVRALSLRKESAFSVFTHGFSISRFEINLFTQKLSALVSGGTSLTECMDILGKQSVDKRVAHAANQIAIDIRNGKSAKESFGKHPLLFNSFYCEMISAGERSDSLETVLPQLSDYREKEYYLDKKVSSSLMFPLLLSTIAFTGIVILLTFVVPLLAPILPAHNHELPFPTHIILRLSSFFQPLNVLSIALFLPLFFILIRGITASSRGALVLDYFLLKLPLLGDTLRKRVISRFTHTLSTLLKNGITPINALSITAKTAQNKILEKGVINTIKKSNKIGSITKSLEATSLFPQMVLHMIAAGEKDGDVSGMLEKIHSFYEEDVDAATDAITSVLEPFLILLFGIFIAGILFAMYFI